MKTESLAMLHAPQRSEVAVAVAMIVTDGDGSKTHSATEGGWHLPQEECRLASMNGLSSLRAWPDKARTTLAPSFSDLLGLQHRDAMKAYSIDLRKRIVQAVDDGMRISEAARVFRVGRSTVKRYLNQQRDRGDLAPKIIPGRTPTIGPEHFNTLRAQVDAWPDASLAEHVRQWARTQQTVVSISTMSRALKHIGWTRPRRH